MIFLNIFSQLKHIPLKALVAQWVHPLEKKNCVLYYSLCLKRTSVLSGQIVWSLQCPLKTESTVYDKWWF